MSGQWNVLVQELAKRYPALVVENDRALRFVLTTPDRAGRIGLRVRSSWSGDGEVVIVTADLGPASRFDAENALQRNATLVFGALVVDDGVLHLRRVIELEGRDASIVDRKIRVLAAEALGLRREAPMRAPAASSAAFAHFGE